MFDFKYRWVSVGLGCLSIICFLPGVFTEFDVATAERMALKQKSEETRTGSEEGATAAPQLGRPDMVVMSTLLLNFGIYVFNFTLIET